jgi:hypothetical protein
MALMTFDYFVIVSSAIQNHLPFQWEWNWTAGVASSTRLMARIYCSMILIFL